MPAILASLVTTFAVLLHAVLGCCWHHAHRDACASVADPNSGAHQHAGCDGHHMEYASDHEDHSPSPLHEHASCDQVRCLFVSTATPVILHDCGTTLSTDVRLDLPVVSSPAGNAVREAILEHGASKSAGDHCALLQVWLS